MQIEMFVSNMSARWTFGRLRIAAFRFVAAVGYVSTEPFLETGNSSVAGGNLSDVQEWEGR